MHSGSLTMAKVNPEWKTSPGQLMEKSWHTRQPLMEQVHYRGECKPCAYFLYKPDGCRQADNCTFCHLCKRGDIKKRKQEKKKALRQDAADSVVNGDDGLDSS